MAELSESVKKFVDEKHLVHFVTLMKNGGPQVTPVWVDHDGTHILINTAEGRQKSRNLERDPRVALSIVDGANPYRYVIARGKVVEATREGAWDHICKLSEKYTGNINYNGNPEETRIIIKVLPERLTTRGLD